MSSSDRNQVKAGKLLQSPHAYVHVHVHCVYSHVYFVAVMYKCIVSQALLQFSGLVDLIGAVADIAVKLLLCLQTEQHVYM